MLGALARGLFGTANDRIVKGFDKPVAKINALEPEFAKLRTRSCAARQPSSANAWPRATVG